MEARLAMTRPNRSLAFVLVCSFVFCFCPAAAQLNSQSGAQDQQRTTTRTDATEQRNGTYEQQNSANGTGDSEVAPSASYQPDDLTAGAKSTSDEGRSVRDNASDGNARDRNKPSDRPVRIDRLSEFELFVSNIAGHRVRRFGYDLLVPESRDFAAPPTTAVPSDYRINPGDELIVGLTGTVQANNLRLTVDQDGRVFIPKVGSVRVGGVPHRDLQSAIASQVARQYRQFSVSVSIGKLHGITVYVTGFAATPGSYTVSSLSTVVNAVFAAGGPAMGGSFRSIQVRRSGRLVSDFDLYEFLLKGDKTGDIVLQNGDVINIAPIGAQVAVIGSVNREAIYEVHADDTMNDVLLYAGGANTVADISRLHVLDPSLDSGWQELTPTALLSRKASRGQVLRVLSTVGIAQPSERLHSLVTISGEVARPGRYFVKPGTTLNEVVVMAGGLTSQAFPYGAVFVRDSLRKQQKANFEKALNELKITLTAQPLTSATSQGQNMAYRLSALDSLVDQLRARQIDGRLVLQSSSADRQFQGNFVLENNDELFVPSTPLSVGVYGMVNSSADFRFTPGLTVKDYVKMAGGYSRFADKGHVFVVRANGTLLGGGSANGAKAMPGDLIFIPINSERGAFWAKLRDLLSFGMQSTLTAAAVVSATK